MANAALRTGRGSRVKGGRGRQQGTMQGKEGGEERPLLLGGWKCVGLRRGDGKLVSNTKVRRGEG